MRISDRRSRRLALAQAVRLNPRAPQVVHFLLAPGSLIEHPIYNDAWRGWPVAPLHQQHPIRSGFLDPRRGRLESGGRASYHIGIDIAVRDDRPEAGAPPGRTHRVYAIEGGNTYLAPGQAARACVDRRVAIGHFGYWHVDTAGILTEGEHVRPGQLIGWTCKGLGHVHLSESMLLYGHRVYVNPLRWGRKLAPFVDHEPPRIHSIRFYLPGRSSWRAFPRLSLPQAGTRLRRTSNGHVLLSGLVDVRAAIDDNEGPPYSMGLTLVSERDGRTLLQRTVFRSALILDDGFATQPVPLSYHYAPGTAQGGPYWFSLFAEERGAYWQTARIPNGSYTLEVEARDAAGNASRDAVAVTIQN